jgi:hypothetical protein
MALKRIFLGTVSEGAEQEKKDTEGTKHYTNNN